jgi:replicative DNA helicase
MSSRASKDDLRKIGFKDINGVYDEALKEIWNRRKGLYVPIKTGWYNFNSMLGGGLQEATMYVVGARPGVGKSAFINRMLFDAFDINPESDILGLYYNFEMPGKRQLLREASGRTNISINKLLSADAPLEESYWESVKHLKAELGTYDLYFRDIPMSVTKITESIMKVREKYPDKHLVCVFDHSRLIRPDREKDEQDRLNKFAFGCIDLMQRTKCTIVLVSQLNRDIEKPDRAINGYVPLLSDLFGADSVGQSAHVVVMLQRPEMYNLAEYLEEPADGLLAVHVVKNRDGNVGWIPMKHNLAINQIKE